MARVRPDHIYVIPPNTVMAIRGGVLRLSARVLTHGQHLPIDHFLRSLAEDSADRSISVILSGTASDETEGSRAIKASGGITFAQDEQSAKYRGMPQSAVNTGCVDFVLPPSAIAHELARGGTTPVSRSRRDRRSRNWRLLPAIKWKLCCRCCALPQGSILPTTSTPRCSGESSAGWSCTNSKELATTFVSLRISRVNSMSYTKISSSM
jgi:CheB methylesterase